MTAPVLDWFPDIEDFRSRLKAIRTEGSRGAWPVLTQLARSRLDFVQTNALDQVTREIFPDDDAPGSLRTLRLAVLGSATVTHLHPAIRVAAMRRGLRLVIYEADFGMYRQELFDSASSLHRFKPDIVLFALDARHLTMLSDPMMTDQQAEQAVGRTLSGIEECWHHARSSFRATVIQQTAMPVFPTLLGNNEHRLAGGRARFLSRLNEHLRQAADRHGCHIAAVDGMAARYGIEACHDEALWHRGKQEVALGATPAYGELVGRLIGALAGRSAKCLALDLDNTLWGGVIGDDGLEGIVLGQGSAEGEAFLAVQQLAVALSERGVILAVCSKNDEHVAMRAFDEHPEMVLRRERIASFVANWDDKATNLRRIAGELNIGLDSIVFLDDNPFERNLVRRELPMVSVPEWPDDPASIPRILGDAGYFESVAITEDDRERTRQYQLNRQRHEIQASATDMESYLRNLDMTLTWSRFDHVGLKRVAQLINKTNQFNLTTRRMTEEAVLAVMADDRSIGLQFRLTDRFGDNGIIAIVIATAIGQDMVIGTWLMSCRVLGRQVERATLDVVAHLAKARGARRLIGQYRPTAKNAMVADHYQRLGFTTIGEGTDDAILSSLPLDQYETPDLPMTIERVDP